MIARCESNNVCAESLLALDSSNFGLSGFRPDGKIAIVTSILFFPSANSSWIRSKTCVFKGAEFQPDSR